MDEALAASAERLEHWMATQAYPRWATDGFVAASGFVDLLDHAGRPVPALRRARVPPRQAVAFAHAARLGWAGDGIALARRGFALFDRDFRREDGLYRTLLDADGTPRDPAALLYDHAFALLALASLGELDEAERLHARISERLGHTDGTYRSGETTPFPLLSNPHMHLLEAFLAAEERALEGSVAPDAASAWAARADAMAMLGLFRLRDPESGTIGEVYDADWRKAPDPEGRLVDPGHQFEWAWLLMRWGQARGRADAIDAALALIAAAELHGVDRARGVVVAEIRDDFTLLSPVARLWPQTERIKANARAFEITGEAHFGRAAVAAADALFAYVRTGSPGPLQPGLWRDRMDAQAMFVEEHVPASSFYHIVFAVLELRRARLGTAATG